MIYTTYDDDGCITGFIDCPPEEVAINCSVNNTRAVPGRGDAATHYVRNPVGLPAITAFDDPAHTPPDWYVGTAQGKRIKALKAERDARIFGGFTWDGSVFDSDEVAQSRLLGLRVEAMESPASFPIAWRLADNAWRHLTADDAAAIYAAMRGHLQAHFAAFALHEAAILAMTDAAALNAYDITAGWPAD